MIKSQNATATIEDALSCAGDTALVAVDVTDFIDVAAMSIFIGYDTNHVDFLSLKNIHPSITGNIFANATDGEIGIAYSSVTGFTINSGKLFDLEFNVFGDTSYLPFNEGTEIANSSLENIPVETFPGSISNGLVIIDQPDSVQAYPDTDVVFAIAVAGTPVLQWQENTGSGWTDLQNNSTYSGVNSDTLMIFDIPLSFNGNLYRCELTAGNCSSISDIALLEVATAYPAATLGYTLSCPEEQVNEPLYVGDFNDVIEFTFNISYNDNNLDFIGLENIHPDLMPGNLTTVPMSPSGISIQWNHTSPVSIASGLLFNLIFDYSGNNNILAFESGSQALNSFSNAISLTLTDGQIVQYDVPQISQQPQNDTVNAGEDAQFQVIATDAITYQWMVSADSGLTWNYLDEAIPYYNTNSQALTISPASFSLNHHLYACIIESEHCQTNSDAAILTVDTLSSVAGLDNSFVLALHPNPFRDALWVSSSVTFDKIIFSLYNLTGKLIWKTEIFSASGGNNIKVTLPDLSQGFYVAELTGISNGQSYREMKKIMKIN